MIKQMDFYCLSISISFFLSLFLHLHNFLPQNKSHFRMGSMFFWNQVSPDKALKEAYELLNFPLQRFP